MCSRPTQRPRITSRATRTDTSGTRCDKLTAPCPKTSSSSFHELVTSYHFCFTTTNREKKSYLVCYKAEHSSGGTPNRMTPHTSLINIGIKYDRSPANAPTPHMSPTLCPGTATLAHIFPCPRGGCFTVLSNVYVIPRSPQQRLEISHTHACNDTLAHQLLLLAHAQG